MANDDVLLHTLKEVALSVDSGLGEHLGGLLEGGCGDEALGLQGGTGDALENLAGGSRLGIASGSKLLVLTTERGVLITETACGDNLTVFEGLAVALVLDDLHAEDFVVGLVEVNLVDELAGEVAGVARILDFDLAHHLTDDDLDVLIGDFNGWDKTSHPLERLDNGVGEILLDGHDALKHGQHVKLWVRHGDNSFERLPAYSTRTRMDWDAHKLCTQVWDPEPFNWTDDGWRISWFLGL